MSFVPVQSPENVAVSFAPCGDLHINTITQDRRTAVLQLVGDLDGATAELLTAIMDYQLHCGRRFLRLDLSGLTVCDAAGMTAIVRAHNRVLTRRGTLELLGVTEGMEHLLARGNLDETLTVVDATDRQTSRSRLQSA